MDYFELMNVACTNIGLSFDEDKYNKFMQYKDMIQEWNQKVNLTAITEDSEIIKKHFIDSIKIFKFDGLKNAERIIDIGTGGGFPGIPMKIMFPDMEVVLLDSLNKRINFLNEVINKLGLKKITAIHGRAEDFAREAAYREGFDAVVSRAVANLTTLSELCIPYVKVGGNFIAMKGPAIDEELKDSQKAISTLGGKVNEIIEVEIEESDLNHNLVIINKKVNTPKAYPRKPGMASKKPLK